MAQRRKRGRAIGSDPVVKSRRMLRYVSRAAARKASYHRVGIGAEGPGRGLRHNKPFRFKRGGIKRRRLPKTGGTHGHLA